MIFAVSACGSLPRGAALQREVTREAKIENSQFQVLPVTRHNAKLISHWPVTGWSGSFHWIKASRGPQSQVLRVGDQVNLRIWDNQANSLLTPVGSNVTVMDGLVVAPDGTIFVPYVGNVVINGLTAGGARSRIQSELSPIAPDAQVQLTTTPGVINSVSVVGGVASPGTYPLPTRDTSILSVLASAGGISQTLRNPLVSVQRGNSTYSIPAKDLFENPDKNTRLRGDDKIIVQQDDRAFTALGASGAEDLIYFPKEYVTALEAVSLMGGLNDDRADPKGILVLREYPAKHVVAEPLNGPRKPHVIFALDLTSADGLFAARNFLINPNDTVLATESPIVAVRTIMSLFGSALGTTAQVVNTSNTLSN
ncbi:MAG: polysaccharide export protein [Rhodobacteraceae bacterium]|nr:MAG: polysaccharide export protein [Paracoccaceae bacterium]